MAEIYRHIRLDTNEVFYIGIGKTKYRAFCKTNRNKHWKNVISKTDYEIEILKKDLSYEEAKELEKILISWYGRKDLGTGTLVNMTDGGEGTLGRKASTFTKNKMKNSMIGKNVGKTASIETRIKLSKASKGKVQNSAWIIKRMDSLRKNNPCGWKTILLDVNSGVYYYNMQEASIAFSISRGTLLRYLSGATTNKTPLIRV